MLSLKDQNRRGAPGTAQSFRLVHVISSGGVAKPDPNAASRIMYGHAGFPPAGMGDGAFRRTPMMTPEMSSIVPAVTLTDTDPVVAVHAEVRIASQV